MKPLSPAADRSMASWANMASPWRMMGRNTITHHPAVRAVLEADELFDFFGRFFGEPTRTFDYKWLRAVGHEQCTGAHYDVIYMGRGSPRLHTCWIPLGDIPVHQGTLAVCEGSHNAPGFDRLRQTYGRLDVDRDGYGGWFTKDPQEITDNFGGQWKTTAFQAGDVLTFGMYTMHASTTNTTDHWRLSCDVALSARPRPRGRALGGRESYRPHGPTDRARPSQDPRRRPHRVGPVRGRGGREAKRKPLASDAPRTQSSQV